MTTCRESGVGRWLSAAVLAAVLWAGGGSPAGDHGGHDHSAWVPIFDFALEVNGKVSPDARFFVERQGPKLLVYAPDLKDIAIVDRQARRVAAVKASRIKVDDIEDFADIPAGVEDGAPVSPFTISSAEVVFFIGDQRFKILPKEPLVGPATVEEILRHSPFYRKGIEGYTPESEQISYLQSFSRPVSIEVYFGSWCSHCKVVVPKFMKAIQAASNSNLLISYTGVPKAFGSYEPARGKGIKVIPTIIFYRNGKEFGRIPDDVPADAPIEEAVAEVLRAAGE